MALDTLDIPAMSDECERLFLASGMMVDPSRSNLDIQLVSQCLALRSWLRVGILRDEEVDRLAVSSEETLKSKAIQHMDYEQRVARVTICFAEGEPSPDFYPGNDGDNDQSGGEVYDTFE